MQSHSVLSSSGSPQDPYSSSSASISDSCLIFPSVLTSSSSASSLSVVASDVVALILHVLADPSVAVVAAVAAVTVVSFPLIGRI
jgi:hypothetical protein